MRLFFNFLILLFAYISSFAQGTRAPSMAYVYPVGVQRGESVNIIIAGKNLNDAIGVIVTGQGVESKIVREIISLDRNASVATYNKFEKKVVANLPNAKELQDKGRVVSEIKKITRQELVKYPDIAKKIREESMCHFYRRVSGEALDDSVEVEITPDDDLEIGQRSIMLITKNGISSNGTHISTIYFRCSSRLVSGSYYCL